MRPRDTASSSGALALIRFCLLKAAKRQIPKEILVVDQDCERLSSRLAGASAYVLARGRKLTGRARVIFHNESTYIEVRMLQ